MKNQASLVQWFRQMAVLINSGVPALRALEICARQTQDLRLREVTEQVQDQVAVGVSLPQAMRLHGGDLFTQLHVGAIEAGMATGNLGLVCAEVADDEERRYALSRKLRGALAYPTLVFSVALLGCYLLIKFLAPVVTEVTGQLTEVGRDNLITRALANLGRLMEWELYLWLGLVLALLLARWLWRRYLAQGRRLRERLLLSLPLVGGLWWQGALIRLCHSLSSLLAAGLPLTQSLELAGASSASLKVQNQVVEPALERLLRGESVSQSLAFPHLLPKSFPSFIQAGERTGDLDCMFNQMGRLYQLDLETRIEIYIKALEPITIALVGLVVLVLLLGTFLPIYEMVAAGI